MRFTPEDISLLIGLVSAMLAIYGHFKTEILMQEKRMTVLEKDNEFLKEFKTTATQRLNNHDEQNKALLVLAEQVKTLSEDVKELKCLITKGE
mgnify:FL=1